MEIEGTEYEARPWDGSNRVIRVQTSPGQFGGEPMWSQHFYALMLDGLSDENLYDPAGERVVADYFSDLDTSDATDVSPLTEDEKSILAEHAGAILYHSESGAVSVELFKTSEQYQAAIDALEAEYESDDDDSE